MDCVPPTTFSTRGLHCTTEEVAAIATRVNRIEVGDFAIIVLLLMMMMMMIDDIDVDYSDICVDVNVE